MQSIIQTWDMENNEVFFKGVVLCNYFIGFFCSEIYFRNTKKLCETIENGTQRVLAICR